MPKILSIYNSYLMPAVDDAFSLGTSTRELDNIWVDGMAFIDQLGQNLDVNHRYLGNVGRIYGYDSGVLLSLQNNGRILITADGAGTPFATPDIDITGSMYFDDHVGIATNKQFQFRDTDIHIASAVDGVLDITADISVDINGRLNLQSAGSSISTNFVFFSGDLLSYQSDVVYFGN